MKKLTKKLIGNKAFYAMILGVVVPIIVQNGITNFVSLLDNIMVGRVGTEQMSGVAIVNQLLFVFNLAIFGALSGAGIFGAQFFGCGKQEGVRHTFRFKLITALILTIIACILFFFAGSNLIELYLHGEENGAELIQALYYGKKYLLVMMIGLPAFALCQCYTSTLRECGETVLPMKAGIVAVLVNLCLNTVLIFGLLGFPALGVVGAAIATVISRYVETAIVILWTHKHAQKYPFIVGAYSSMYIPGNLVRKILIKGSPLLVNEVLWASGVAVLMQCYSVRGLEAVAALNISSTISNLFNIVFISMGNAVSIIVGQLLGAGKMEEAKDTDTKMIAFSVMSCMVVGMMLALFAPFFPLMYNTTDHIRHLATRFILITATFMPMFAFLHSCYFTLRAGGKTVITFLFDSVFMWVVCFPVAYILSRFTSIPVVSLYLFCQMLDLIKCVVGYLLVKKNVWLTNIVSE